MTDYPSLCSGAVFLDATSLNQNDLNLAALESVAAPLRYFPSTKPQEVSERVGDAWCVIVNKVVLDEAFFEAHPGVRLVCVVATGTNNVDLEAAAKRGVAVVNCQGYSTQTVAQHSLMLILALARSLPQYHADVSSGAWTQSPVFCMLQHPIREAADLRLGIVGYGAIGQEVARLATALGMEVVISERPDEPARDGRLPFEKVLETCNVISLHCPLTPATDSLIDVTALRRMREDALLINTSRGGLVDEPALVRALREGWIAGAAVDVLSEEPPPDNHPLIHAQLPNLVVTPHCAWGSRATRQRAVDQTVANIAAWLTGDQLRRVI